MACAGTRRSTCCSSVDERTADDKVFDGRAATVAASIHITIRPATTLTNAPADASSTRAGPACMAIHRGRPRVTTTALPMPTPSRITPTLISAAVGPSAPT